MDDSLISASVRTKPCVRLVLPVIDTRMDTGRDGLDLQFPAFCAGIESEVTAMEYDYAGKAKGQGVPSL